MEECGERGLWGFSWGGIVGRVRHVSDAVALGVGGATPEGLACVRPVLGGALAHGLTAQGGRKGIFGKCFTDFGSILARLGNILLIFIQYMTYCEHSILL